MSLSQTSVPNAGEQNVSVFPRPLAKEGPVIRIAPSTGWVSIQARGLWEYRELLYFLVWRDLKVRYRQTILGATWALIQPVFTMLTFTLFFGHLAKIPSDGIPYPLFSLAGLVPWALFSHGLNQAANSLVGNSSMIKKIYFPRLLLPIAKVVSGLVDFGLALILLLGMILFYGIHPSANMIWLPVFVLLAMVTALGVALWLSAANVQFRDVQYLIPFMTQIWLFATPIAYPSSLVPKQWRVLYGLNPMVGVVDGFRWCLLDAKACAPGPMLAVSCLVSVGLLVSGAFWFRRMEKNFADVL